MKHNLSVIIEQVTETLNALHPTVHCHLKYIGKVSKLGKWVPHPMRRLRDELVLHRYWRRKVNPLAQCLAQKVMIIVRNSTTSSLEGIAFKRCF